MSADNDCYFLQTVTSTFPAINKKFYFMPQEAIKSNERKICCVWKISQGLIEGYSLAWVCSERRGRLAVPNNIPRNYPSIVKQARERSLGVHGVHLFNMLPIHLQNENSQDFPLFKNHLDFFLATVPDQPNTKSLARAAFNILHK